MFNKIDRSNLIPTTYELKKIIPHVEYSIVEAEIPLISMKELGEEAKFKLFGHADTYFGKIFLLEYFNGTAVEIWKAHLFRDTLWTFSIFKCLKMMFPKWALLAFNKTRESLVFS